ncbi:MAG TPA: fibronectin type III domain-containing protein [Chloroflexota bacterium]|jgi:hypothetical protein|nr:fibronectin type III domain-containing protein [Chloroflexota bacterium]
MITRVAAGAALLAIGGGVGGWSAEAVGAAAAHRALPACTVTLPSGSTNQATLQLVNNEVLCAPGTFTNKRTITVAGGGSAVIKAPRFVNDGLVNASAGTSLQLTDPPANLRGTTLTGGQWSAGGTISLPAAITTLAASVTLSGGGEIEDSTNSANAVDSLSKISRTGALALDDSAYLATGSVTSAGAVIIGTKGNAGDAVNWQDSGTFTMTGGSFVFLDPNACINVGARAFTITGGTVSGFGMLTGTVTVSGDAVFAPTLYGAQASFSLNGSYSQTGGTFQDTVNNPSGTPGTGALAVSGAVSLGGTLEVLSTGKRPQTGTSLQIVSGSSAAGQFKAVQNAGVAGFSESTVSPSASIVTMASSPPSAPRTPRAVKRGSRAAKVSWTPPSSNGGQPVTGYVISARPGCACKGLTKRGNSTSTVVSGLRAGRRYTFAVEARNVVGTGVASVATNSVKVTKSR